ncbi:11080_t:CDS:2 [Scutellospora calospora]|uniref:11080_t:CDS:1 n=1 Tax=Scutellospora calospora TaxID=85575 RepID=A0ACA9K998_9GLOM|nr:11080_t:CDS:2 [Scutellospora calospora]
MWTLKVKLNEFITLAIIFLLKISGNVCFGPEGLAGHVAVNVSDRMYFMGGSRFIPSANPIRSSIRVYNLSDEVFVLDLSSQFSTSSPPYIDLSNTSRMLYGYERGTVVLGGASRQDIFLIGGVQQDLAMLNKIDNNATITSNKTLMIEEISKTYNQIDKFIYYYRPNATIWSYPQNQRGIVPTRRRSTATVINKKGVMYIFGGRVQVDTGSPIFTCYNDLYSFDTVLLSWNKIDAVNAPLPQSHSAPVLLPSGKILYIGGVSQTTPGTDADLIDMTDIRVFDTVSSTWSYKTAILKDPSISIQPRISHTATLTSDNNEIIIIGGNSNYNYNLTTATPVFVSLNIATENYEYSELITSGDKPPLLAAHTANLYQNYLIVAFGNITNFATPPTEISSRIYLLDMPCKVWVTTFTPGKSTCKIPSNGLINKAIIAIIVCSSIVVERLKRPTMNTAIILLESPKLNPEDIN